MCTITATECACCTKFVNTVFHCRSFLPHEVCKDIKTKFKMTVTCKKCRDLLEEQAEMDDGWYLVGRSNWSSTDEMDRSRK